ncbi:MAG: hypothetical protein ACPLRN_01480, partial [Microgenomates group bacterium]
TRNFFFELNQEKNFFLNIFYFIFFISAIHFFIVFQARIKILSSEQWHLGEKKLFEKILSEKNKKSIYIINNEPKETFMLFSFYHLNDANQIKNKLKTQAYNYKNIVFTNEKLTNIKDGIILIKRGTQDIDKLIENKLITYQPYLEASDKSGILYYKIEK